MGFIEWLGHASFRINASKIIYIDPWKTNSKVKADIILVTHEHFDHFSPDDIKRLSKPETRIILQKQCLGIESEKSKPGSFFEIDGVKIEAVAAYNTNKFMAPGKVFHPKEDGKVGYVITVDGKRIYHSGDTDFIPEMNIIDNIDYALLPVSGTYVMDFEEAAEAANIIDAKLFIPMHYGDIVGTIDDAMKFKSLVGPLAIVLEKTQ